MMKMVEPAIPIDSISMVYRYILEMAPPPRMPVANEGLFIGIPLLNM